MSELPPLTTDTIWAIINQNLDDATVNQLVWESLGYRYDNTTRMWDAANVDPEWSEAFPKPPNFIESRPATVRLTRSIPKPNKQLLKEKLGFKGYKIGEFGPRETRRATVANWLLGVMQDRGLLD
ncbi:protein of unknown function (DUF1823) [Rubidibacter lacunae KORDI 51-2]|uniref:DUF1823 domain-containing protein n=1 Tax=Rubidibacter lacunae KORDI 51-2 TaxID=582515 RepID=U5DJR5_9CHRO|nr:DUF1823 family protein [Rubidibacter lacunae]ERN40824.1 protein of unknown function (DUF1823) [Rubidibacter lacunae KORDI 51-2]